jgi:pantoate--beta-alanine ligase
LIAVMARDLNLESQIVLGPIIRESDGLAMSSRNVYLTPQERAAAAVLYRALAAAKEELSRGTRDALELQNTLRRVLASEPLAGIDYAEIVDAESFEPVARVSRPVYLLLAVYLGKTRLIDNMLIEPRQTGSDDFVFHL